MLRLTLVLIALAIGASQALRGPFYTLLFYGALVTVKCASPDELETHRTEILDRLGRARPDWSGTIVALAQILEPDV